MYVPRRPSWTGRRRKVKDYSPVPDKPRHRRRRMPNGGNFEGRYFGHRIKAYHTIRQFWGNLGVAMAGALAQSEPRVIRLALNRRI